jgi:hypothetical protein
MLRQPGRDVVVLVGVVVVEDDVQLPSGVGSRYATQEVEELGLAVPLVAPVGDLPGGQLEGGEQGGRAVADIVVGRPLKVCGRAEPVSLSFS